MQKRYLYILVLVISFLHLMPLKVHAFWIWTPETNKWVNPKYDVKDTPQEQLDFALEFYNNGQYKETIRELKKLLSHYPRSRQAPEAQFHIGLTYDQMSEPYEAFKAYQEVVEKYPFSNRSSEIVKKQYEIGVHLLEGEKEKGFFKQAFAGDPYTIIDIFKTVIKNAPYGDLAAPSQYKIGLYLMEKGLYQEARDEFEKLMNDYPNSEWTKAAKYQIAITDSKRSSDPQYEQKVTQVAVEEFKDFVKNYPDAELSEQAKEHIHQLRDKEAENIFVIAEFYEKQKKYDAAKIYFQKIVDNYKESQWSVKSLEKIRQLTGKNP